MLADRRVLSLMLLLGAACGKKAAPPPPEGLPPLPQAERVHRPVEQENAGHPASPQTATETPLDPASTLAGEIRLDPKVKAQVSSGDTIFLVARGLAGEPTRGPARRPARRPDRGAGQGAAPGPVLAVERIVAGVFPQKFSLDSRNAMVAGTVLSGEVTLTARVDKDGDAMSKRPGDVTGSIKVTPPNHAVVLKLDRVLGPQDISEDIPKDNPSDN